MKTARLLPIYLLIFLISLPSAFASRSEMDQIKKLENRERSDPLFGEIQRRKVEFKDEGFRDPFTGLHQEKGQEEDAVAQEKIEPPNLTVQGVIWGTGLNQAIINDKVVKAGDTVSGCKVLSISKAGIKLLYQGKEFDLSSPSGGAAQTKEKKTEGGSNE